MSGRDEEAPDHGADDPPPSRRMFVSGVRTRALVSFMLLLVVSTAASLFVLRAVLLSRIGDQVDEQLTVQVDTLGDISGASANPPQTLEALFDRFFTEVPPLADGTIVGMIEGEREDYVSAGPLATPGIAAAAESVIGPVSATSSGELRLAGETVRYVAVPAAIGDDRGTVIAIGELDAQRAQVGEAVRIAAGVSLVVMLLASLFIWLAAGRTVAPLKALARAARTVTETDLSRRIPVRGHDEIAVLGRTFNSMLDRLETGFANQKEFLTDVSHELRTPITVIRGYLETLGDDPAEREEAIAVVQDELDRMNRLVDDLLLLAKASRPDFLLPEPVDLDLFTHDLYAKVRSLGPRNWRLDGTGIGIVRMDAQRLTQAVMNLAENAVRHTNPEQEIAIGSSLIAGHARIWVRDQGPGISLDIHDRIFDRHVRADGNWTDATSDGAGVGLAIVKAVAEGHGGAIRLESTPGSGSTFTIEIPAVGAERPTPVGQEARA
ncbi:HAMP domain-containing histidine kinase [Thermoleophilia bacterium SCSIO 60948]|nr:HAMP domain-containing histidine kinase [Thermoleophilia bacterium SCSIO 60948]